MAKCCADYKGGLADVNPSTGSAGDQPVFRLNADQGAMEKTLFEKRCDKGIPADIVYEDEQVVAFRDIAPAAPTHVLVIPRKAIPRINEARLEDQSLLGHLLLKAAEVARSLGLGESGFRLVINNGSDGGESVPHLHCHILGGRSLQWPPG